MEGSHGPIERRGPVGAGDGKRKGPSMAERSMASATGAPFSSFPHLGIAQGRSGEHGGMVERQRCVGSTGVWNATVPQESFKPGISPVLGCHQFGFGSGIG